MAEAPGTTDKVDEAVALPPRKETFLARYSRNFKFGLLGTALLSGLGIWFLLIGTIHYTPKVKTTVLSADKDSGGESEKKKARSPPFLHVAAPRAPRRMRYSSIRQPVRPQRQQQLMKKRRCRIAKLVHRR